jgi:hypothetical protein
MALHRFQLILVKHLSPFTAAAAAVVSWWQFTSSTGDYVVQSHFAICLLWVIRCCPRPGPRMSLNSFLPSYLMSSFLHLPPTCSGFHSNRVLGSLVRSIRQWPCHLECHFLKRRDAVPMLSHPVEPSDFKDSAEGLGVKRHPLLSSVTVVAQVSAPSSNVRQCNIFLVYAKYNPFRTPWTAWWQMLSLNTSCPGYRGSI